MYVFNLSMAVALWWRINRSPEIFQGCIYPWLFGTSAMQSKKSLLFFIQRSFLVDRTQCIGASWLSSVKMLHHNIDLLTFFALISINNMQCEPPKHLTMSFIALIFKVKATLQHQRLLSARVTVSATGYSQLFRRPSLPFLCLCASAVLHHYGLSLFCLPLLISMQLLTQIFLL